MKQELPEHQGKIKIIDRRNGFGYVKSEFDNKDYKFKTYSLQGEIQLFDKVAFIIKLKNGKEVADKIRKIYQNKIGIKFVRRIKTSHIHKGVEQYWSEVFEQITDYFEEKIERDFDLHSIIGKTTCVPTDKNDEIFYAIREDRLGHSRFVLNRQPLDTNFITVILLRVPTHYLIITSYLGTLSKPEPWDVIASQDAFDFWNNHAIVFGEEDIIIESKTYTCPWVLNQPAISKIYLKPTQLKSESKS
jgi:hypothetical protein